MNVADHPRQIRGDAQTTRELQRAAERAMQGFATVVVENEHGRLSAAVQRERLSCPAGIEQRG
jgi:hypothetical protein